MRVGVNVRVRVRVCVRACVRLRVHVHEHCACVHHGRCAPFLSFFQLFHVRSGVSDCPPSQERLANTVGGSCPYGENTEGNCPTRG